MSKRGYIWGSIFGALFLLIAGITVTAGGNINIYDRLANLHNTDNYHISPGKLFLNPDYPVSLDPVRSSGVEVEHLDHRYIAQLAHPPIEDLSDITVTFTPSKGSKEYVNTDDKITFYILASIRYGRNSEAIYVTTARLSPKAKTYPVYLGEPDHLADGTPVWIISQHQPTPPGSYKGGIVMPEPDNQVMLVQGDLLIALLSDRPVEQIKALAKDIIVRGNQPN